MDNFVQMDGNSDKTGHDQGINTEEKDIHEFQKTKKKFSLKLKFSLSYRVRTCVISDLRDILLVSICIITYGK